jgi:hypothetical protein
MQACWLASFLAYILLDCKPAVLPAFRPTSLHICQTAGVNLLYFQPAVLSV